MSVLDYPTKEEWIHQLAESGVYFSKHLRDTWTGELKQTTLRIGHFTGRQNDLYQIASLNPPLVNALSALPVLFLELSRPLVAPPPTDEVSGVSTRLCST